MERALLQVRDLIESTVTMHRDRSRREQLVTTVPSGPGELLGVTRELIEQTDRGLDILGSWLPGSDNGLDTIRSLESDQLCFPRDTVTVRMLADPEVVPKRILGWLADQHPGMTIRAARLPPVQVLMADRTRALVVADPAVKRRASLVRAPEVLHTLGSLFDSIWNTSPAAGDHIDLGDRNRALLIRQILGAMGAGATDEAAARDLLISVRTYRRYVAEIMSQLGATSRFQAGVRAVELGLLPRAPAPGQDRENRT